MIAFLWECTRTWFPTVKSKIHKISRGSKSLIHQRFKRASTRSPQRTRKPLASPVRPLSMAFSLISRTVSPDQATDRRGMRAVAQWKMQESRLLTRWAISQAPETPRDQPPRDAAWLAALPSRVGEIRPHAEQSKTKDDEFLPANRCRGYRARRNGDASSSSSSDPRVTTDNW